MVGPTLQVTGGPARVALTGTQVPIEIISGTATHDPHRSKRPPVTRHPVPHRRDPRHGRLLPWRPGQLCHRPRIGRPLDLSARQNGRRAGPSACQRRRAAIGENPTTGAERRSDQSVLANVPALSASSSGHRTTISHPGAPDFPHLPIQGHGKV